MTSRDTSQIGAESRWREGIFFRTLWRCLGRKRLASTPDSVEATQAIKLELDQSAWDVELLSGVKRVPWDRERQDPTIRVENTVAGKCSFASLEKEEMEGRAASARHEWKVQYVTTELGGTSRRIQETKK